MKPVQMQQTALAQPETAKLQESARPDPANRQAVAQQQMEQTQAQQRQTVAKAPQAEAYQTSLPSQARKKAAQQPPPKKQDETTERQGPKGSVYPRASRVDDFA